MAAAAVGALATLGALVSGILAFAMVHGLPELKPGGKADRLLEWIRQRFEQEGE